MDLSNLKPQGTFTFNLRHPVTDEELDTTITVHGTDSKVYKKAFRALANERIDKPGKKVTVEKVERNSVELIAAAIDSWENLEFGKGNLLDCTRENKIMVLDQLDWLFEQIKEEVEKRANFLQHAEKS